MWSLYHSTNGRGFPYASHVNCTSFPGSTTVSEPALRIFGRSPASNRHPHTLEKLSSIEDGGQTYRIITLPRQYEQDIDLWSWTMTLIFNPSRAMVMTHTHTNSSSEVSRFKRKSGNKRTDRRTDRRTLLIALHSRLTWWVKIQDKEPTLRQNWLYMYHEFPQSESSQTDVSTGPIVILGFPVVNFCTKYMTYHCSLITLPSKNG